jgi:hypothetical protein
MYIYIYINSWCSKRLRRAQDPGKAGPEIVDFGGINSLLQQQPPDKFIEGFAPARSPMSFAVAV